VLQAHEETAAPLSHSHMVLGRTTDVQDEYGLQEWEMLMRRDCSLLDTVALIATGWEQTHAPELQQFVECSDFDRPVSASMAKVMKGAECMSKIDVVSPAPGER
jgi:hypothetical protein